MNFLALARDLYPLLRPTVTLFYPLYRSIRTIQNPQSEPNQQQWLTYWILYSLITLFELYCLETLAWIPFWPYIKLAYCFWLVCLSGATHIFEKLVKKLPMFEKVQDDQNSPPSVIDPSLQYQNEVLQTLNPDAKRFADQFIKDYGSESFKRVVKMEKSRRLKQMLHDSAL